MEFNFEGQELQASDDPLVPVGGKLPYYKEVQTKQLLDFLQILFSKFDKTLRKRLNEWLYSRTKPGFYLEIKHNLHLAYADQRHGHGTQHWWRLFFDEQWKNQIEQILCGTALSASQQNNNETNNNTSQRGAENTQIEWGGMYFRSQAEVKIARELDKQAVLFFANARGRVGEQNSPVSKVSGCLTGRIEVDFLVFKKHKYMILEVDGQHHNNGEQTIRDYVRDRVLLREGIPTVRFTGKECLERPIDVVNEFFSMF